MNVHHVRGRRGLKERGFTLIEVLVVIGVIGVLAAVTYVNFNDARKQARDGLRQSALEQLQVAIELYKQKYGTYPDVGCSGQVNYYGEALPQWAGPGPFTSIAAGQGWGGTCDEYIEGLVPEFMEKLPQDPSREQEQDRGIIYTTNSSRTSYKALIYGVETILATYEHPLARCPAPCAPPNWQVCGNPANGGSLQSDTYAIYSVGAECW